MSKYIPEPLKRKLSKGHEISCELQKIGKDSPCSRLEDAHSPFPL